MLCCRRLEQIYKEMNFHVDRDLGDDALIGLNTTRVSELRLNRPDELIM